MKHFILTVWYSIIALTLAFTFNLLSCGWDDPCYRNFGVHTTNIVQIDRAEIKYDTLYSNQTEEVLLWGTVGTNSGYTFKGIEAVRYLSSLDLTVWNSLDIPCGTTTKDTLLKLTGYTYYITPPLTTGTNSVKVHQPNGSAITLFFFVR